MEQVLSRLDECYGHTRGREKPASSDAGGAFSSTSVPGPAIDPLLEGSLSPLASSSLRH